MTTTIEEDSVTLTDEEGEERGSTGMTTTIEEDSVTLTDENSDKEELPPDTDNKDGRDAGYDTAQADEHIEIENDKIQADKTESSNSADKEDRV